MIVCVSHWIDWLIDWLIGCNDYEMGCSGAFWRLGLAWIGLGLECFVHNT